MIGLTAAAYCCFQLLYLCGLLQGLLYEGGHLSLSVWRKITVNVFYSTFTNVFLILSRFYVFNVFFIFGGPFFSSMLYTRLGYTYGVSHDAQTVRQ